MIVVAQVALVLRQTGLVRPLRVIGGTLQHLVHGPCRSGGGVLVVPYLRGRRGLGGVARGAGARSRRSHQLSSKLNNNIYMYGREIITFREL